MVYNLLDAPATPYHKAITTKLHELALQFCVPSITYEQACARVTALITRHNIEPECMAKSLSIEAAYFGTSLTMFALETLAYERKEQELGRGRNGNI